MASVVGDRRRCIVSAQPVPRRRRGADFPVRVRTDAPYENPNYRSRSAPRAPPIRREIMAGRHDPHLVNTADFQIATTRYRYRLRGVDAATQELAFRISRQKSDNDSGIMQL
jgi:hypothetical protein